MPIERLNRTLYNKEGIDNMKLIAMTNKGTEYLHSKTYAFFASDRSAKKICDILNKNRWKCNTELELWHVYDHDFTQDNYVYGKFTIYNGVVKLKAL